MTVRVPTAVPELLLPSIQEATERLEETATEGSCEDWRALTEDRNSQACFLASFSKTFNITISLARSGAGAHQLMRWRNTEISFVNQYNNIHNGWVSKLISSAMIRAVGYLSPCDPQSPTLSGFREDATGTPIYEGADSKLTLRLLEAHFPEVYSPTLQLTNPDARALKDIPIDATGEEAADAYALVMGGNS